MQKEPPEIVIGDILLSNIRPWKFFPNLVTSIIISSYELITKRGVLWKINKFGGLRSFLELGSNVTLWLDSGGFQLMKKDLNIPVEKICQIYREVDADIYISLDYPTTPGDTSYEREKKIRKNIKNFDYLTRKLNDKKIIPVIHFSPKLEDYDYLLRVYLNEYGCNTIAFGGFVPPLLSVKGTKKSRLKGILALQYIALIAGRENVHVMGVGAATTISILNALKIKSADSAAWRVKAAYGKIILPWGGERHVTDRKVNFGRKKLSKEELFELANLVRMSDNFPFNNNHDKIEEYLVTEVFSKFEKRALFNAWVVLSLAKKVPPRTGSFKHLHSLARKIHHLDRDAIIKIWRNIDNIKQSDLLKFLNSVT